MQQPITEQEKQDKNTHEDFTDVQINELLEQLNELVEQLDVIEKYSSEMSLKEKKTMQQSTKHEIEQKRLAKVEMHKQFIEDIRNAHINDVIKREREKEEKRRKEKEKHTSHVLLSE